MNRYIYINWVCLLVDIYHLYGDVTIASERAANIELYSALLQKSSMILQRVSLTLTKDIGLYGLFGESVTHLAWFNVLKSLYLQ